MTEEKKKINSRMKLGKYLPERGEDMHEPSSVRMTLELQALLAVVQETPATSTRIWSGFRHTHGLLLTGGT